MDSMKRFAQDFYKRHERAFALHSTNDEALESMAPCALDYSGTLSAWSREFFLAAVCTCDLVHVPVVQHHWQDDLTLSSRLRLKKFPRSAGRCSTDAFSGSPNGRTLVTTAKTGCLSSPLVMNPRLSAKERSKSTGWASSTVICVRGCGPGVLFSVQTGSISVTGSLAAARTRVYDTNPPLVGLVGLVFSDYRRYAWFSCRSSQHCRRGHRAVYGHVYGHVYGLPFFAQHSSIGIPAAFPIRKPWPEK